MTAKQTVDTIRAAILATFSQISGIDAETLQAAAKAAACNAVQALMPEDED